MPTLASCIRRAGKALSKADADAVRDAYQELVSDGMPPAAAAVQAVDEHIDTLGMERAELAPLPSVAEPVTETPETNVPNRIDERPRFALTPQEQQLVAENPYAIQSIHDKIGATAEEMISSAEKESRGNFTQRVKDGFDQIGGKRATLGAITLRHLPDFSPGMTKIKDLVRELSRMSGRENELMGQMQEAADPWIRLYRSDRANANRLAGVMQESTLAGIDPSRPFSDSSSFTDDDQTRMTALEGQVRAGKGGVRAQRELKKLSDRKKLSAIERQQYDVLRAEFDNMSEDAQAIYSNVRDTLTNQYELSQNAIEQRIQELEADESTKSLMLAQIRKTFESGRVTPYFPLARYGKYWSVVKDADGEVLAFSKFDSLADRRRWEDAWIKEGYTPRNGEDSSNMETHQAIDPEFVKEVMQKLDENSVGRQVADDIWQMYLARLPEISARKSAIHRKNIRGFTGDAIRAFANHSFHAARNIARTEHVHRLSRMLSDARDQRAELSNSRGENFDPWAAAVFDEAEDRYNWAMNPQVSAWSSMLTNIGSHIFLGVFNPSAAAVNLTQNILLGLPNLSARQVGFEDKVTLSPTAEMAKAFADVGVSMRATHDGMMGVLRKRIDKSSKYDSHTAQEEWEAIQEMNRIGVFERTRAFDLIGAGEVGSAYATRWRQASEASMFLFHQSEVFNRHALALASYRLARDRGETHEQAIETAEEDVWNSHFDYSNVNRPRYMQGDFRRVIFLFRNYAVNMFYAIVRTGMDSIKGATPQQRAEARQRLKGMVTANLFMSGATGVPFVWGTVAALQALFGDDDDPYDPDMTLRAYLENTLGETTATAIMDGGLDAITGGSLSTRVSYSDLIFRELAYEPDSWRDMITGYMWQLGGPIVDYAVSGFIGGLEQIGEGAPDRGIEMMMPKTIKDLMKVNRYSVEGVTNWDGQEILGVDEMDTYDYILQGIGVTPKNVAMQYSRNRAVKFTTKRLNMRWDELRTQYINANRRGNKRRVAELEDEIMEFQAKNPDMRKSVQAMRQSFREKKRRDERGYVNGVRVPRKLRERMREMYNFGEDDEA